MKEFLRASAIANRVRMLPHQGVFLLVEGVEDAALYGAFVDESTCRIVVAYGKPNVLGALASLRAQDPRVVLGIIDADFMILDGEAASEPDVLLTDFHDLEMMLLASPALDRVLREFRSEKADAPQETPARVRERLLDLGTVVGLLRWLSHREDRRWLFRDMDFDRFVDDRTLTLKREQLLQEIQTRSRQGSLLPDEIWPRIETLASRNADPWHVCCGHDLVTLLGIGLRRVWGTNNDATVTREQMERSLRLAYTRTSFEATNLHAQLRAWEEAHPGHRILSIEGARA